MFGRVHNRELLRAVWNLVAGLMALYMCANVTVLEYYGGNPELGIVSYRQVVLDRDDRGSIDEHSTSILISSPRSGDSDSEVPDDGDDCFVTCSHTFQAASCLETQLNDVVVSQRDPNFLVRQIESDWHRPLFYRPPRIS